MNELKDREISCRLLTAIFDDLEKRNFRFDDFVTGSNLSPDYLKKGSNRISWKQYAILMNNLTNTLNYNTSDLIKIGQHLEKTTLFKSIMLIAKVLFTLPEFYEWLHKPGPNSPAHQAVTCFSYEIAADTENNYRLIFKLHEGYSPVWQFYYTSLGVIQILPTIYGLPPIDVEMEIYDRGCIYSFHIPVSGGKLSWLRKLLTYPSRVHKAAAQSLMYANAEIYEKNIDLQRENARLINTQKELESAKQQAEAASKAKSQFMANISHELRTPLNGIIGTISLMLEEEQDSEKKSSLAIINESSELLLKLLNEILNFSKIESGRTQFRNEPFDLHQLQAEVIAAFSSSAKLKKTKLVSHSNIKPNSYFIGDTLKIRQILNNLISNAIKFCDEGTVTLSTLWETTHSEAQEGDKEGDQEGKVCFMVSDTGIGIPKDQQQAVFSEFIQLDNRLSRKYEGTGLGLAITQKLVEKMGGSITLASELGKGSTFTVTLPLQPTQAPQVESHDEINNTSHVLNILLVEDNKTNQMVISRLISKSGHHSVLADNGVDCLKKVKQCHFDLILMDIMMPEMDGIQATQELRKIYSKDTLPILALSANTETDNIEKCMEAGMNEYLHKPIRIHELKSILNRYSHRSSDTATP